VISNKIFFFVFLLLISVACSSTKETTKQTSDSSSEEVYVFDDVSDVPNVDTTLSHEAIEVAVEQKAEASQPVSPAQPQPVVTPTSTTIENGYTVQIGAFSTRDKAETFVKSIKNSISYLLTIKFVEKTGLHAVQLSPFKTRKEAENARNELWKNPKFSDAFIVYISN